MKVHELSPAEGSVKAAWRKGRGPGTGNGKTAGRGHKGQNARSGGGVRPGFEGGQIPLYRRLPKRGFTNIFAKDYALINVSDLEAYDSDSVVDVEKLINDNKLNKRLNGLKVLGRGELTKKLTVRAKIFSESAKKKIEAAGGKAEVI